MNRSVQWLNQNSYRSYPFVENADLTAGAIVIPNSAVLDISGVNYDRSVQSVALVSLEVTSVPELVFTFAYADPMLPHATFTVTLPANPVTPYRTTVSTGNVHRVNFVFGVGLNELLAQPVGVYTLNTPAPVEPSLFSFQNTQRVNSLSGSGIGSAPATGIVSLAEGWNCSITVSTTNNSITVSAERGAGKGVCSDLIGAGLTCKDVLLSINGFHADTNGNFDLIGGDGVTIVPDPANHTIRIVGDKTLDEMGCGA